MAANFRILTRVENGSAHLQLQGDFDGTSAHELIRTVKGCGDAVSKITIDTDGLKEIHPFGIRTFGGSCGRVAKLFPALEFTGRNAARLADEMSVG
jgi:hypothetical protein